MSVKIYDVEESDFNASNGKISFYNVQFIVEVFTIRHIISSRFKIEKKIVYAIILFKFYKIQLLQFVSFYSHSLRITLFPPPFLSAKAIFHSGLVSLCECVLLFVRFVLVLRILWLTICVLCTFYRIRRVQQFQKSHSKFSQEVWK